MSTMARKRPLTAKIEGGQDKRVKSQNQQSTDIKRVQNCERTLRKRPNKLSVREAMAVQYDTTTEPVESTKITGMMLQQKQYHEKNICASVIESIHGPSDDCHVDKKRHFTVRFKSQSIVNNLFQRGAGYVSSDHMKQAGTTSVINLVKDFRLYRRASPFDRRCTVVEWHPSNPSLLAAGSKGGDIILWNIDTVNKDLLIEGRGPGGSISAMKFHPSTPTKVYTSALDGKVSLQDFHGRHSQVLLDTMTWDYWYTSMDIQVKENLMVAGESTGKLTLMSMEGKQSWTLKLHKNKITHAEFSKREPWLLCTASTDKTCKLWDVRMVKDKKSALYTLEHTKPVNSAYFSLTDGTRLLTTDQHNEICVYSSPNWHQERTIVHPHRFFQHITPIKAQWHPLQDIIVIGRYPDDNCPGSTKSEPRTVDLFCSQTGKMLCQLLDSSAPGIVSLNKFSHLGERLASTMGVNILVWEQKEYLEQKQEVIISEMMDIGVDPRSNNTGRSRSGGTRINRSPKRPNKQEKNNVQKKLNLGTTKTKTKDI